jgi:restriction endonuclease S subunit
MVGDSWSETTLGAIARILGTLDDKIELNRRMNDTLESMVQAIFKSWFVDFGPVRAKAEGRDPGLPTDIADLFPDRLVDSELGEIPAGWFERRYENERESRTLTILRKYGYPPDKQEQATQTVLEQAEVLSHIWAAA